MSSENSQEEIGSRPGSKLASMLPLAGAAAFMVIGILILIYIGRDTARLMNAPLGDMDLYTLIDAESKPTLDSMKGKVVVLHFWGTWCPPCRAEYPEFAALSKKYAENSEVEFISVSCSGGAETDLNLLKKETKEFLDGLKIKMPIYSDPAMYTRGRIATMLSAGGFGYPMTLVIDPKGIVREYWIGALSSMSELDKVIIRLTNEKDNNEVAGKSS